MYANNAIFLIIALIALVIMIGAWIAVRMINNRLDRVFEPQPAPGPYIAQQQPVAVVQPAPVAVSGKKLETAESVTSAGSNSP